MAASLFVLIKKCFNIYVADNQYVYLSHCFICLLPVHLYHEVLQLLKKASCDICLLQSERVEGEKYILAYESVDDKIPHKPGTVRAKVYR